MTKKILWMAWFVVCLGLLTGTLRADGLIVVPRPGSPFPLEVVFHRVSVAIEERVATTEIDQVFANPGLNRLEGVYLFPVPSGAVIEVFSMWVEGREVKAELLEAGRARRIYEDIVRRLRDPALLEYTGNGVLRARIFPIEPRSRKRVRIRYRELISEEDGWAEYLYPLNTEKFSAAPLEEVSVRVDIRTRKRVKHVHCPSHKTEIDRMSPHHVRVVYEAKDVRPNRDFRLFFATREGPIGFSLQTVHPGAGEGYFCLNLKPDVTRGAHDVIQKDIVFVLDSSGSMAGDKLDQVKRALLFCVENLNAGDRFEVIRFSTEVESLFAGLLRNSEANRRRARRFIDGLQAVGGTNISEALDLALGLRQKNSGPFMVIFLTDGKPTIGETDEEVLIRNLADRNRAGTRIFTFGIGNDINTHLLDRITRITRGTSTYITPSEDIEVKVSRFYDKVKSPVLTDLKLSVSGTVRLAKCHPHPLPDLFSGSSLSLFGRYRGSGRVTVTLEGSQGGVRRVFRFPRAYFNPPGNPAARSYDFIPALWAARRVGYLLDLIRLQGRVPEIEAEIVALSRRYGILTPYTSYLIVEDERNRSRRHGLSDRDQILAPLARTDPDFLSESRRGYDQLGEKTGSASVRASRVSRELEAASHIGETLGESSPLSYRDRTGEIHDISGRVVFVKGRAFYHTGIRWIDGLIPSHPGLSVRSIRFAGTEYFRWLADNPAAAPLLALGRNLRFVWHDRVIEVYE